MWGSTMAAGVAADAMLAGKQYWWVQLLLCRWILLGGCSRKCALLACVSNACHLHTPSKEAPTMLLRCPTTPPARVHCPPTWLLTDAPLLLHLLCVCYCIAQLLLVLVGSTLCHHCINLLLLNGAQLPAGRV